MSDTAKPKQAASVILLRRAPSGGIEVLLTRRPDGMAFLGGMYCFPGGTLQKDDYSAAALHRCYGLTTGEARKLLGAHFTPQQALGIWICAVRELYEEVGVLLAVNEAREPVLMKSDRHRRRGEKHNVLLTRSMGFNALLEAENLRSDVSRLRYFSYWQTPEQFPMRFDTRFYIAALPSDQIPLATSPEVAHSLWLSPDRALQMFDKGSLPMIFPTFASLRTLADFDSVDSVFGEFNREAAGPMI
ncbi:MAG: NUDIX hydrolase [Candidatus Binatia bacterium]